MKRFCKALFVGLVSTFFYNSAKADFDYYALKDAGGGFHVYTCVNATSSCTKKVTQTITSWTPSTSYVDEQNNLIIQGMDANADSVYYKYNPSTNSISAIGDWRDNYAHSLPKNLIRVNSNGVTSIGENSLKLKETATTQEMWATNSSGSIAPINITNGTKLLINGRDVEQSIDNVGALSAALTALPTVPTDSPISCGIGTGTHSGNYAFSGGCASKVNEKLSFNAAASFVPGQDYQGTDNSYSARAGFVFKLGKTSKKELISKKEKQLDKKVSNLQTENKELKSLIAKQNERLEKLEEIALALKLRNDLEVVSMAE